VRLDAERAALQVQQAQQEVAALQDKVRNGRIAAPVDGRCIRCRRRRGFREAGGLAGGDGGPAQSSCESVYRRTGVGRAGTKPAGEITWDALPNRSWVGKTEIIPKQVVARGSRSVGELLCSVNNDKLELLQHQCERANQFAGTSRRAGRATRCGGGTGRARYVFVVKKNQLGVGKSILEKREIQVGIADATSYEVVSGCRKGHGGPAG